LKMIKTERRTSLGEEQLDNLLRIAVDSPPLSDCGAVKLWWEAKQRRIQELHHVDMKKRLMVHLIRII